MLKPDGSYGLLLDTRIYNCSPVNYLEFAGIGIEFANSVLLIPSPKVRLINIREEEEKGNMLSLNAHKVLKKAQVLNFTGNIEGRDFFDDKAYVLVCDSFKGKIICKLNESFFAII